MFRTTYLETYKNFTRVLLALSVSDLQFIPAGQVIGGGMEVEDVAMALERLEACRRRSDELVEFLKYGEWEIMGLVMENGSRSVAGWANAPYGWYSVIISTLWAAIFE